MSDSDITLYYWQNHVDILAKTLSVSSALIMRVEGSSFEILFSSDSIDNPYHIGDKKELYELYYEAVINTKDMILVPNALKDPIWGENLNSKLKMISFLGFPIELYNREIFGIICVLDSKENYYNELKVELLRSYKVVIEGQLNLIHQKYGSVQNVIDQLQEDITTKHDAEKQLKESEERYRSFIESSPVGIIVIKENRIQFVNQKWLEIYGYNSEAELIGQKADIIHAPIVREKQRVRGLNREAGGLEPSHYTSSGIKKDGTIFPVEIYATRMRLFDGSGTLGFVQDVTEQFKAQQAIKESEERYRSLVENAPEAIFVFDLDENRYIDANSLALELYKIQVNNLDNVSPVDLAAPIQPDGTMSVSLIENQLKNIKKNEIISFEWMARDLEGHIFPTEVRITGMPSTERTIVRISVVDITERKQKEEELKHYTKELEQSRHRLSEAQRIGNMGHWSWNHLTNELIWSDQIYRIFDVQPQDFKPTYDNFLDYTHPEDRKFVKNAVRDALHNIKSLNIEHRIITVKKEKIIHGIGAVTFDSQGDPVRFVGTVLDITEKKAIENELIKSKEMYLDLYNQVPAMLIAVDAKTATILNCNNLTAKTLGYEKKEIIGLSIFDMYHPSSLDEVKNVIYPTFLKTGWIRNVELKLKNKDGNIIDVILDVSPIYNEKGEIIRSSSVWRDITEIKKAQTELQKTREQFAQSSKMDAIGRLAGGIAHDFNNLLTGILGYSSLLRNELPIDSELFEFVEEITKAGNRGSSLIKQLLEFSKGQVMESKIVDLNYIVKDTSKMLRRVIGEHIELELDLIPNLCNIKVDPIQLNQVIMNLVINARDAMPEGGILRISTENVKYKKLVFAKETKKLDKFVSLTVSDNGLGMDQETQSHIFEPFYTTKTYGTGLGLATTYGIVSKNDGHIEVTSELGKGTSVTIYFPMTYDPKIKVLGEEYESEIRVTDKSVLIVEDNDTVRNLISKILKEVGFDVVITNSPYDALSIIVDRPDFDLIISDVIMPRMNGFEFISRIQEGKKKYNVIFITGYVDQPLYEEIKMNKYPILEKPFTRNELIAKIKEIIND